MKATRLAVLLLLSAPFAGINAQVPVLGDSIGRDDRNFSFYSRGPYRASVPRPESILGYNVGELNTQFALQERVLLAIADAARDRIAVETIGMTNERRAMRLFIISAPENISRLESIRADLDRLSDPRGLSSSDAAALIARTPAVVWINESVHGNEAPGFENAMQTLYQLAASEEPATLSALRNTLVILNPSTNPDGHERFAAWYNSIHVGAPEGFALEHGEPWSIQGRFNHYRFDMNRDVMTTTQIEVQNIVRAMNKWHPMVAVDQHGQTTNYFFPPTAEPLNPNLGADFRRWMEIYGRGNASAFDRYGWMYYSRDVFDFYGPFYWDSWPSLTGAIGMTYETDCGGWKGILWRREDGSLCSFRDGIAKHFVTSIATIETTGARRADRVADWHAFRRGAVDAGRTGEMKRVVLVPGNDPARAAELAATLLRSGIEVRRVSEAFSSSRAHSYRDDSRSSRRFEAGAYVIDLAQPQGLAAKAVLEPAPDLDNDFARAQIDKLGRNLRRGENVQGEGYEFYDVTAWSLPVTFGVEAYWTEDAPGVAGEMLTLPAEPTPPATPRTAGNPSVQRLPVAISGGIVGQRRATAAYVFSPERSGALRLAYRLLADGFRVAVSNPPMDAGGRRWPRGSFIVRVARNDSSLHARIERLAVESGVEVMGVGSAFAESGQFGIGSESVLDLAAPRVALVGDEGISQTAYGAVWWSLEHRYGVKFTPVSARWLGSGDLSQFNVIIMPSGSSGALNRLLGKAGADALRSWIRAGGTLVTMGGSTAWGASSGADLTSARAVGADADTTKLDATGIPGAAADSADDDDDEEGRDDEIEDLLAVTSPLASNATPVGLPGSHFDVVLDRTHWLTQGYDVSRLTVMMEGSTFLKLSRRGANVAVFPAQGKLHRAGFIWPDNTERFLRNTAYVIEEPIGGGHLVAFAGEPWFRGWWRALDKLVMNAIVLGPGY
ncbi:MAG TPA: M14 family zinc carboxypeptidase [Gemmatimonadaceae bacterium]|nr:M14 family zinc carboxypeptidase [Gemmatimonadaceae bacterium]